MTVTSTTNRKTYTGDGATVAFATSPVVFFDEGDLTVYLVVTATGVATLQTITTHYTVSGGSGSTGTVTMVTAPSASQTLVIVRDLDIVQEVDFVNNEATDAEVAEDALDKLTMMAQQNAAAIARSFKLADSDVSGASTEIPTPSASKLIGWDSAGTALANYAAASIVDTIVPTAFAETLLDDANAATARTTLDAQQDVFTTRGDLVRAGASGVAERVALGTSGQALVSDGTDAVWGTSAAATDSARGTVELATSTEIRTGTDTGRVSTPAGLLAALGFSAYFQSAAQTITYSGALTLAHSLGRKPVLMACAVTCVNTEGNYVTGDEVFIASGVGTVSSNVDGGVAIFVDNGDTTNVKVRFSGSLHLPNKTTGVNFSLTAANWTLVVRAWG